MRAVLLDLVQFVPIVLFAAPFLVTGEVDLDRAGEAFLVTTLTALVVIVRSIRMGVPLNPIATGADLWLMIGSIAFQTPLPPLVLWIAETQGAGLFLGILAAMIVAAGRLPRGAVGVLGPPTQIRWASAGLVALTVVLTTWAFVWHDDLRIGGGLPFIVLNIVRRLVGRWLERSAATA